MGVGMRQDVIDEMIALLKGAITSAQEVLDYKPDKLDGKTPVIALESLGSAFPPLTQQGVQSEHDFAILVFVKRTDPQASPPWTARDAEKQLNEINEQIKTFIKSGGGNTTAWGAMDLKEKSRISYFKPEGGVTYLEEDYPITVFVYS